MMEKCQLTLMFTDIVGYSRLMGRDQEQTIAMLEDYRRILVEEIGKHHGTVIEFIGDAVFARFDTPLHGTEAAIAIQKALFSFNHFRDKSLPRLQTRIGLHCGEVATKDKAIFGDNVNIAARLEPAAVADGICVSEEVYKAVKDDIHEPVLSLGVLPLKNIQGKTKAYLIRPLGISLRVRGHYINRRFNEKVGAYRYAIAASVIFLIAAGIYFIPRWLVPGYDANYIEIADFKNLNTENGTADYFSAGITDAIRSQLADMRDLYVIDAKDKANPPVALEGSVLRINENLRIEYRIIRNRNNVQIAGGKIDGKHKDLLIIQDRLVGEIAQYLSDEFDLDNFRPAPLDTTNNVSAYDYYLKGQHLLRQSTSHENYDTAIQMFSTALVHDSSFSNALTGMCEAYRGKYFITYESEWLKRAEAVCNESLELNPSDPKTLELSALLLADDGMLDAAINRMEKAREADPDSAYIINSLAQLLLKDQRIEEAEKLHLSAVNQSPDNWEIQNDYAYFLMEQARYKEAIDIYKHILKLSPNNISALHNIGTAYGYLNDLEKSADYFLKANLIEPRADTYLNISTLYFFMGDIDKAIKYNKEALRLNPNNFYSLIKMGSILRQVPEKEESARKHLNKAIAIGNKELEKTPGKLQIYHYLAIAYALKGDIYNAKEIMSKASILGPESLDSLYSHLTIAVAERNTKEILRYVEKLLNLGYDKNLLLTDPNFELLSTENLLTQINNTR